MPNIFATAIVLLTYLWWGLWLLERKWSSDKDLDAGFFISIIPVAISTWYALYLAGA